MRTLDSGLLAAIDRRMKELKADHYVIDTENVLVDDDKVDVALNGDIYFLASDQLDLIAPARLKLSSSDNYLVLSQDDYEFNLKGTYISFRDYLAIRVEEFDEDRPFYLTFYAIRPILN